MHVIDLEAILEKLPRARIGIVGDFCLDAYWELDMRESEISVETKSPTRPVRTQRYGLGGAGNVAQNMRSLGVSLISVYGVTGRDPFGYQMRELMNELSISHKGLLEQTKEWVTHSYIKPIENGAEENRIDMGNFNRMSTDTAKRLSDMLTNDLESLDILVINQQVKNGIHMSPEFQKALQLLIQSHPQKLFLLDSRSMSQNYQGTIRKINAYEAVVLTGGSHEPQDIIGLDEARNAGITLAKQWGKPVFVTRGDRGCLVIENDHVDVIPGLHIIEKTDPVGAGDSMLAGMAASMAVGCCLADAATFGNLVAGVTVQKLYQTGTASPDEILKIGTDPDYIFLPEKADDLRSASYWKNSEIEVINAVQTNHKKITHAIFDHDGTISVLREGWEKIMEPMMVRAILGPTYDTADETAYHQVLNRVRLYIDATTGVQTLVQMQGLVKLVTEFGYVSRENILDQFGYKAIYNEALLDMVKKRLKKLSRGELTVEDFVMKKAVLFLMQLHQNKVKLYLASGSDEHDVVAEAEALGYADLFEGRIYGAIGDATKEAKKIVMDRILADIGNVNAESMAVFGDGPVEIRESKKHRGLAIGVASDEVRRFGLNESKRRRLIRAGADLIIADFSQFEMLLELLQLND
ncbi:MAG: HAD family hydrolase [Lentisphaerae bacterium]|nr:HAD family hydrolase [Lentisphaerota bacterium]